MGWFMRAKRGVSWKDQALDSISLPPLPLVVFFGLFVMLMSIATYSEFKGRMERGMMSFRLGLVMLPLVGILIVIVMMLGHRWWWRYAPRPVYETVVDGGSLPWGLVAVLVLVLVLAYHQTSFHYAWFRSI